MAEERGAGLGAERSRISWKSRSSRSDRCKKKDKPTPHLSETSSLTLIEGDYLPPSPKHVCFRMSETGLTQFPAPKLTF